MKNIHDVISRFFYDYTIDPARAELIIDLRTKYLKIPANFVKFEEDKMYIDGTLLPQNRIVAILYQNEYWLKRPMKKKPIEEFNPRIPLDYPIKLWMHYPEFLLLRFAYKIMDTVEKKLQENMNEEWFEVLGDFEEISVNGEKFWVIKKGIFQNTIFAHSTRKIIRTLPTIVDLELIKNNLQFQRIAIYPQPESIKSYFAVRNKAFEIYDDKISITDIPRFWRDFLLVFSITIVSQGIKWYLFAAASNITKRFIHKNEEKLLAIQLGIPPFKPKEEGLTVREIYEYGAEHIVKIFDFDTIFAKT